MQNDPCNSDAKHGSSRRVVSRKTFSSDFWHWSLLAVMNVASSRSWLIVFHFCCQSRFSRCSRCCRRHCRCTVQFFHVYRFCFLCIVCLRPPTVFRLRLCFNSVWICLFVHLPAPSMGERRDNCTMLTRIYRYRVFSVAFSVISWLWTFLLLSRPRTFLYRVVVGCRP